MLSFKESLNIILDAVHPQGSERIPTKKSFGRVLDSDIMLTKDFPEVRLSAIDGYAFCISDCTEYKKIGSIGAGRVLNLSLEPGECAAVMTGAIVPEGTDCMVKVEDCIENLDFISTQVPLKLGDLINEIGSEAKTGGLLVKAGTLISKSVFPTLFYAGKTEVNVCKIPRIGLLLTGDELCDIDDKPLKGQIFDTNGSILQSFLNELHLPIHSKIKANDNEQEIQKALKTLEDSCDIVISSGGVSMGKYDYIKKILTENDYKLLIQGTAIKPGKPLMVAQKNGKLIFGMPGYPAAFLTNCLMYLVPAIKKACGRFDFHHRFIKAILTHPLKSRKGKLYLNRIKLEISENGWLAQTPDSQQTSHFLNFSEVNGLAFLDKDVGNLEQGAEIKCLHFDLELS